VFFFSVLLTSPSLFFYPYSYLLTFLLFPVLKSIALPPIYSSCPFSSTLSPCLHPSLNLPNLLPHYHFLLHTHHPLTSLLYQLYTTQAPSIPDTSTLHYNNRNTPKHAQGPQNLAARIPLPQPPLFLPLPFKCHLYQFPKFVYLA
jgi:hypothetical protein